MENDTNNVEASKDGGRVGIFSAVSTIAAYAIHSYFPQLPIEVVGAILVLLIAVLTYVDSWIHRNKTVGPTILKQANGLTPF